MPEAAQAAAQKLASAADTRFDRRLGKILAHATEVFCAKGYAGASMRDLARATGISLAGLYHYFDSKERLLYLIQKHTFATLMERLRARLAGVSDPEQRVRIFILNHLEYFLANQKAMKVLSHEDEILQGRYGEEVRAIKREYYRVCRELVEGLAGSGGVKSAAGRGGGSGTTTKRGASSRIAVVSLFGMMNWIYTWHNPRLDANAQALAQQMGDIFLHGILAGSRQRKPRNSKSSS